jgi:hypothetical protein
MLLETESEATKTKERERNVPFRVAVCSGYIIYVIYVLKGKKSSRNIECMMLGCSPRITFLKWYFYTITCRMYLNLCT